MISHPPPHSEEHARTWWFADAGPKPVTVVEAPPDDPNDFQIVPASVFAYFWDYLRRYVFGAPQGKIAIPRLGSYRHYKGAYYQLLGAGWYGRHAMFVYREALKKGSTANYWVRPQGMWSEKVTPTPPLVSDRPQGVRFVYTGSR